jgi:hypothetical protein
MIGSKRKPKSSIVDKDWLLVKGGRPLKVKKP